MTMKWSVEPDGKGKFNAVFTEKSYVDGRPLKGAALSHVSKAKAESHVAFCIKSEAERDAKKELVDGMFNRSNWKMPTTRVVVATLAEANAIHDALAYFCGGAEIEAVGGIGYEVGSLGYYHYIGA